VEAAPVLVNGRLGPGLDTLPHSLLLFEHVIAGVEHEVRARGTGWTRPGASSPAPCSRWVSTRSAGA